MKIALPMRMTRSERVKMRVPPAGPLPAGDTPTTDSGTYGSSQRSASRVVSRGERDDSVVVCAAAVHHAGSPRLLVHEPLEGVSEQFHLEQCAVDGHRSAGDAGDLQTLAVVGLTRVAFVEKLDVDSDDLLVVALDLVELLADVYAVVIGHLDVAALDDDVHALTSPTVVLRVDR